MFYHLRLIVSLVCIFSYTWGFSSENFLLINGTTKESILELGSHIYKRITPCSTFKIALSLMGFDSGILKDEMTPMWDFQEGYDDFLESWKAPHNPQLWMKNSCIWYSQALAKHMGLESLHYYLAALEYGNQDISGGLTQAWLSSSLTISPKEQVDFIQKMVQEKLPIASNAIQMTKRILFIEELPGGWKLFGKTGGSGSRNNPEIGWFVGWVEKDAQFFPFAYNISETKINPAQRIPRVKELLMQSRVIHLSNNAASTKCLRSYH